MKAITKENFNKVKPSYLVRSYAWDVNSVGKKGIDMSTYDHKSVSDKHNCTNCLGSVACKNLGVRVRIGTGIWGIHPIADLGDSLRSGGEYSVCSSIRDIFPEADLGKLRWPSTQRFTGIVSSGSTKKLLKQQIHRIADALEAAGC